MTQFRQMSRTNREKERERTRDDTHLLYSAQIKKYSPFRRLRWPFWHDKLFAFVSNKQQDLCSCKSIQLFLPSKCIFSDLFFSFFATQRTQECICSSLFTLMFFSTSASLVVTAALYYIERFLIVRWVVKARNVIKEATTTTTSKELELIPLSSCIIVHLTPSTERFARIRTVSTAIRSHQVRKTKKSNVFYRDCI